MNKEVSAQLASVDDSGKKRRATYMIATPEQKAKIGKYAAEIGTTKAIRHFTKDMPAMFKGNKGVALAYAVYFDLRPRSKS